MQRAQADFTFSPADHRARPEILNRRAQSLRQSPDRIAKEHADGGFPAPAVRRGRLGVPGSGDLREFVLTHRDGQYDFADRPSLAPNAGTLGCRHRHWWCPMNIEINDGDHEPNLLSQSLTGRASRRLAPGAARVRKGHHDAHANDAAQAAAETLAAAEAGPSRPGRNGQPSPRARATHPRPALSRGEASAPREKVFGPGRSCRSTATPRSA